MKKLSSRASAWGGIVAVMAVVLSPVVAGAAFDTKSTTVNANLAAVISMTTSSTVNVNLTPTSGGVTSSASDTVTVATNNSAGYNLVLKNGDTNTNLVNGGNTIAAHAGTYAAPTALALNTWGYAVAGGAFDASYSAESNVGSSSTKWAGVLTGGGAGNTIKTTAATASGDVTTVWYAVRADTSKPSGTYADSVTYTATTN